MSDTSPVGRSSPASVRDTPVPGWYHDPFDTTLVRWWDGRDWTGHVQRPAAAAPAPNAEPAADSAGPAAAAAAAAPAVVASAGAVAVAGGAAEVSVPEPAHTDGSGQPAPPPAAGPSGASVGPPAASADILSETSAVVRRSLPGRRTVAVVAAATVGVLVVAGLGAWQLGFLASAGSAAGSGTSADPQPVPVAMAPNVSPRVGDCFTGSVTGTRVRPYQVGALGRLPCSARHVLQVFALAAVTGPLPAGPAAAYLAAERRCPAPDGFLADHVKWMDRFQPVPIVGTSASAKGRTWVACAVALSGSTTFEAVQGSLQSAVSAPGAMARFGRCSPARPGPAVLLVPCRTGAGMWLAAAVPLAPPGAAYPGPARVVAAERAACARYAAVTAPHTVTTAMAPNARGWALGDRRALCFLPLDHIPGATTA